MSAATLGARVKARREALELTMRELPGLDHSTLSRIESGKLADPGLGVLRKLSKALGMTLEELDGAPASAVRMVELRDLHPDLNNPRDIRAGSADDQSLVDSIKALGLLQPLAVRNTAEMADERTWTVVDGHRRYAALVSLHGPKSKVLVPCRIVEADNAQTLLMQLVANVQRADMNPLDLANGVGRLVDEGMDTQAIAEALGRKRRWVQEQASVARYLTDNNKFALREGSLNISQAVALASERNPERQDKFSARVLAEHLGEDDIRAAIADARQADAQEAAERESSSQLDLVRLIDPAPAGVAGDDERRAAAPKPVSGWKRWQHARGYFKWQLQKIPDRDAYVVATDCQWRRLGCTISGWGTKGREPTSTAAGALAAAIVGAWSEYVQFAEKADVKTLTMALIPWLLKGLARQGADPGLVAELQSKLAQRINEKFEEVRKPAKASKRPAAPPAVDLTKPPKWATPEWLAGPFMYHTGTTAWLVHGWPKLLELIMADNGTGALAELHVRSAWQDDREGKPFDYGSCIVRLQHARP